MAIEWKRYPEQKPEQREWYLCKLAINMNPQGEFWFVRGNWEDTGSGKHPLSEGDLFIEMEDVIATAAPGAKLYTGEEMNQAEYNAYHAGRDSLLSPSDFID